MESEVARADRLARRQSGKGHHASTLAEEAYFRSESNGGTLAGKELGLDRNKEQGGSKFQKFGERSAFGFRNGMVRLLV